MCYRHLEFRLEDVQAPDSIAPLQTFQAAGRVLYIDDATFANKELLEKLTPTTPFDLQGGDQHSPASGEQPPPATGDQHAKGAPPPS